jgi:2-amino-4-hydroxy-6-hydroxymethyldihydropteridine diphosphokinase
MSTLAYIALGSNLDDPAARIRAAIAALGDLPHTALLRASSLYRSPPFGYASQPDFINAVAAVSTTLTAPDLLDELLQLEARGGRVRTFANAPRTLDLDLLLYGQEQIERPGLTVPHPRLAQRAFVLVPLAEIAPDSHIPGQGDISRLLPAVLTQPLEKLSA